MKFELCDLLNKKLIPKKELDRVFTQSMSASAEMDYTFLCFEEPYLEALKYVDKDSIIIDLGCSYAAQSFYFTKNKYIGIDLPMLSSDNEIRFTPPNAEFYIMSIQNFIHNILPTLNLDMDHVIAICSAVPDEEARELVKETFPNYIDWYPGQPMIINISERENMEELEDDFDKE